MSCMKSALQIRASLHKLRAYRAHALGAAAVCLLASCASSGPEPASVRYRCEYGIEFSARFSGESVSLDSTRGYELLFRDAKPLPDPPKPGEYRNPRMSVEFGLGANGREALLRYPLLPLVARCVKDL
jgi:hypothetical protein